jgi:hypothetical protein
MEVFRRAVNIQRNTARNFTARQCMTRMAMRHHAATDKFPDTPSNCAAIRPI